jgi:hypothetical protein
VVKVDQGFIRPEPALQLFACHHFPSVIKQNAKYQERLTLEANEMSAPAQFTRSKVQLEASELRLDRFGTIRHGR